MEKLNLPHLASDLDLYHGGDEAEQLVIHDDYLHGVPMSELNDEMIPVLVTENLGHRGVERLRLHTGRHSC